MARPGITYIEVAEAASQLTGQGVNPTIEQIRRKLGTGSSTTIANHLRSWKDHLSQETQTAINENLPQDLVSMMKGLWQKVINHSEEKIQTVEAETHDRIAELEKELEKYKHNNKRWQRLFYRWTKDKEELSAQTLSLKQELDDMTKSNDQLNVRNTILSEQLSEKQTYILQLKHDCQQLQDKVEHVREHAEAEQQRIQLAFNKERESFNLEIKQIKQQNEIIKEKTRSIQDKHRDLQHAHATLSQQHANVISQNEKQTTQLKDKEKQCKEHQYQLRYLEQRYHELQKDNAQTEAELINTRVDIKAYENRLVDSEEQLKTAKKEIDKLVFINEKMFITT